MTSIMQLKKMMIFEAINQTAGEIIGYYFNKAGTPMRRKLKIRITESGKVAINQPTTLKKQDYEAILSRHGIGRSATFTEIEEIYDSGNNGVKTET